MPQPQPQLGRFRFAPSRPEDVILAIDFGTSNSLVAAATHDQVTAPLPVDDLALDPTVFRSILYFADGDHCFYGQAAIEEYGQRQADGRLIRSIKKYLPSESFVGSWIDNRMVRLEDLIGYFLLEIRKRASRVLGCDVQRVLLGRPAKFSDDSIKDKLAQHRLQRAAEIAGFRDVHFLAEPLAAAFDLRRKLTENKNVLVVDLGGGTSDFTVIQIGPTAFKDEHVLAIGGISVAGDVVDGEFARSFVSPFLGGKVRYRVPMGNNILQMPKSLLDHICSPADISQLQRSDYLHFFRSVRDWSLNELDREALDRLFAIVEDQRGFQLFEEVDRCKREVADHDSVTFSFQYPDADFTFQLDRPDFDSQVWAHAEKILQVMDETVLQSGLKPSQIDLIYCTGGTSKLRTIQAGLRKRFPEEKILSGNFFHSVIEGLVDRARDSSLHI